MTGAGTRLAACATVLSLAACPVGAQMTSSADDPLTPEEQTQYQISCVAFSNTPHLFQDIGLTVSLPLHDIAFDLSFSFNLDRFITTASRQIMAGKLISQHGRLIYNRLDPSRQDTTFYVLSSDWNCTLYRGDQAWPARN